MWKGWKVEKKNLQNNADESSLLKFCESWTKKKRVELQTFVRELKIKSWQN